MGNFGFRRSKKILPGVRVTATHKGLGISGGVKGARVGVNSKGRVTKSANIPGSGIGWQETTQLGGAKRPKEKPGIGMQILAVAMLLFVMLVIIGIVLAMIGTVLS